MLASAVFFYGSGDNGNAPASLFDAYDLIRDNVGKGELTKLFEMKRLTFFRTLSCCNVVCYRIVSFWSSNPNVLFLVGPRLICDFQSSSLIATVAGQAVSEGFLNWHVSVRLSLCSILKWPKLM